MSAPICKSNSMVAGVVALLGAATLATAGPAYGVQYYTATPLGSFGGTYWGVPNSRASAINASGQVTGSAFLPSTPSGSGLHAFIHANGALIDLGTLGGELSEGSAINDSGQVTGASATAVMGPEGTITHAFLWSNGKMTDLGSLGGYESEGMGINASGHVAGRSLLADGITQRAFVHSGGGMTDLGTLGGTSSLATGINDSGQITGAATTRDFGVLGNAIWHAFLYSNGTMRDLGTLGGGTSRANALNNAGDVAGQSDIEGDAAVHAFLYAGGRMIDLGTLGGSDSVGTSINNRGQVVGHARTAKGPMHAFLYTDGKMYDLNGLVTNLLDPEVVLRHAYGINDRGQIAALGCKTVVVIDLACEAYRLDPIAPPSSANYQGLWWNAPAESESGWGINFAHQGDTIFATWFTYDSTGEPQWLSMTANRTASGTYEGALLRNTGPAFNAVPFDPAAVNRTSVGVGALAFADADNGTFTYVLDGTFQVKALIRQVWGPLPTCSWSAQPDLARATNYQDLWWVPNGAESGWGVNLTHQGDVIFATWFTYDFDGSALWLSGALPKVVTGIYSGMLERTTGPPFYARPFDPDRVTRTTVGTLTISFADGNAGSFAYSMYGVTQLKAITRQVFYPPAGTVCTDSVAAR